MFALRCMITLAPTLVWLASSRPIALAEAGAEIRDRTCSQPLRSADFVQSIGVNTHLAWSGPWASIDVVTAELAYLGIVHLRDSVPTTSSTFDKYLRLVSRGLHFAVITTGLEVDIDADLARLDRLQALDPRSIAAVEGVNEFNVNHATFSGKDSFGDYTWGRKVDAALAGAARNDVFLKNVTVVASSMANAGMLEIQKQGDLTQWVDASNWHAYFSHGDQPFRNILSAAANARATAPGKPVFLTEAGYYTAVDAMTWGGGGVDEDVQAKMTLNLLLDAQIVGIARTYLYELMDNVLRPAKDDLEGSFGLFHGDGSPKKAAIAIHNFLKILSDKAKDAATFAPVPLAYTLLAAAAEDRSLLIAQSDGSYNLVLWNETSIWNATAKRGLAPSHHVVTIALPTHLRAETFDPFVGTAPVANVEESSRVDVWLGDRPLVIAISRSPAVGHDKANHSATQTLEGCPALKASLR